MMTCKQVVEESMSDAVNRLRGIKQTADIGVSVDGIRGREKFLVNTVGSDNYFY